MSNRWIRVLPVAAADAAVLALLQPSVAALRRHLGAPHRWLAAAGPDRVVAQVAGAALWLVAAWVAIGLAAAVLGQLPGALGRAGRGAARALLPRVLLRLVAGSAGLGVLLAPIAAHAQPAPRTGAVAALPAPIWPSSPSASVPVPAWPVTPAATPDPRPAQTATTPAATARQTVTVRPGDSLWLLAAHRLGPDATPAQIAHEWPRWFAANRAVIGSDAAVLHPGQVLDVPNGGVR